MLHVNHFCLSLLQTCQALCNGMADCRAFVRFTSTGVCIFYGSVGEAQPLTGFDYYRRRNSCDDDGERTTLFYCWLVRVSFLITSGGGDIVFWE